MLKTIPTDTDSGKSLSVQRGWGGDPVPIVANYGHLNGHFKAATRTSAGTTEVVSPLPGNAIVLTDLVLTTDKVQGATVTISFTDGSNSVDIVIGHCTDAPCNITIPFGGLWRGWQSAGIGMTTVNAVKATLAIGYFHCKAEDSLQYSEWNAKRL